MAPTIPPTIIPAGPNHAPIATPTRPPANALSRTSHTSAHLLFSISVLSWVMNGSSSSVIAGINASGENVSPCFKAPNQFTDLKAENIFLEIASPVKAIDILLTN